MKKIITLLIISTLFTSCVSKKLYQELQDKYNTLKDRNVDLVGENDTLFSTTKDLKNKNASLTKSIDSLQSAKASLHDDIIALQSQKEKLKSEFRELSQSSNTQLDAKAQEILRLSQELEEKENKLIADRLSLEKTKANLTTQLNRIKQLETLIAAKEQKMQALKNAVSNALQNFEGNGLTVYRKNGKVYVSMENKLLFSSGSWSVGTNGVNAVKKLASVLTQNKDVEVFIEGHTDNVPYHGGNAIKDNWDLSTKRATAIVRILVNNQVNPKQITAAGRGEFMPVDTNSTNEGKSKNRRIEVILAPNLDEINSLIN